MNTPAARFSRPGLAPRSCAELEAAARAIANAHPGQLVKLRTPHGAMIRGRVVFAAGTHLTINAGGRHGTPYVATPANLVL